MEEISNMDEEKKRFIAPEATVIDFLTDDIITYSTRAFYSDTWDGEKWEDD